MTTMQPPAALAPFAPQHEKSVNVLARAPAGRALDLFDDDPALDARGIPSLSAPSADRLAAYLKRRYRGRIAGELWVPPREARYAALPDDLVPALRKALGSRGIDQLYRHQRQAWDAIHAGRHVVVVTPTASGKSLCYNLPAMQAALTGGGKSLYLFPTKALAQDQVAEILELNRAQNLGVRACTFDGDTPADARRAVRLHGDIVVTNPDMLHQGILPHHTKWAQLFENLRYVVIDELHTYRGVFGAHVANLVRRLRRICAFYGARPTFILTSATIGNPVELAETIVGDPVHGITESGAPSGAKHLLVWNPPVVDPDLGLRASARSQSSLIARLAVRLGLKTIVFANSRLEVEVLTKYLKDVFDGDPRRAARIAAYRGGYLPTERRDKEQRMRAGLLDCVVSTSALELGVDIGALDVCVLNGYPGTIASALQRMGRAGRRGRTALGVLVATSDLLDQYLARNPEFFLGASPERAHVDPEQLLILMDHVRCGAFELPFRSSEAFGAETLSPKLEYLAEQRILQPEGDTWHWIEDSYPANAVSLRSVAEGNFTVVDITDGAQNIIAEVDYSSAAVTLYEGAIYMVQSVPWQVEKLDWVGRKAFVRRTHVDYYTDAIDYTKLKVLDEFEGGGDGRSRCSHGEAHVVRRVAGYKKIRYYTHENVGYGNVHLPDQEMHTTALWWTLEGSALDAVFASRFDALDGFLGAAYALHHLAALLSLSELRDIGRSVGDGNGAWSAVLDRRGRGAAKGLSGEGVALENAAFHPTVFLYDNYPGGIGLAAPLYDRRDEIVMRAKALVAGCSCAHGCPACIGPILRGVDDQRISPKAAAVTVLGLMLGRPTEAPRSH